MIKIYPKDGTEEFYDGNIKNENIFPPGYNTYFLINAKEAIKHIIKKYSLSHDDEVYISTTQNTQHVSTCVTGTIFNYCGLKRKITKKTKLIYVIHSFGFYNKNIEKLKKISIEKNLPLVEDYAHSMSKQIKYSGDYIIHSLSKIFPIENGGVLVTKAKLNIEQNILVQSQYNSHVNSLNKINFIRRSLYELFDSELNHLSTYNLNSSNTIPFSYGFKCTKNNFHKLLGKKIELLQTHIEGQIDIPLNAFFKHEAYINLLNFIKNEFS